MKITKNNIVKLLNKYKQPLQKYSWVILVLSTLVLGLTSYYVANKSAIIHSNNTDQLIDSYMFENTETFQEAIFPAAHSFFLKWPLFALSSALGNSAAVYTALTILVYLMTIFGFLYIIYRLTKKDNLVTAFIALCLSSILLFIPAQPMDNSYLPVNMAMLTTRNLEFLVLFLYIYFAINIRKLHSLPFYLSVFTLGVLGATDKYFLMLALLGSVLYVLYRIIIMKKKYEFYILYPFISGVLGFLFATIILSALSKLHITGIPDASNASPFALTSSVWQMFEATAGAIQGIVVNFGAGFFGKSASLNILPYAVNGLLLLLSWYAVARLFFGKQAQKHINDKNWQFTLWLVLTFIAACILFVASKHEFLKDARYLTGALFAGIAAIAYLLSTVETKHKSFKLLGAIIFLLALTPILLTFARTNFTQAINANQTDIGVRTDAASDIIEKEDADLLVSDYWFSAPTKLKIDQDIIIVPMSTDSCDTPNSFLTSTNWIESSGGVDKSAYYILRDAAIDAETFNHGCTMDYLNQKYGEPEKEYVIRGTTEEPIDTIRIYPYDIRTKF